MKAIDKQDQSLGRISSSLRTLKNMSHQIGEELEDQSEMLDELGNSMSGVESRMDEVMKKLSKLTRLENGLKFVFSLVTFFYTFRIKSMDDYFHLDRVDCYFITAFSITLNF